MSLLDAFLNEGYRDPHDVWIALRNDARGSGSIDDPYDGSVRIGAVLSGVSLSYNPLEVIIDTNGPHGFAEGQSVEINGVTPSGSPLNVTSVSIDKVINPS